MGSVSAVLWKFEIRTVPSGFSPYKGVVAISKSKPLRPDSLGSGAAILA